MKKSIFWILGLLFSVSLAMTSCDETDGATSLYADWEERNQAYIDSIARVARANQGEEVGQWKIIHTYKFTPPLNVNDGDVNDFVYCKILEKGTGELKPVFSDKVTTHYRGKLIPLYDGSEFVFDQSFRGELNPETAVPVEFGVGEVIVGWTTALQEMREGDRWEVVIPFNLAYGQAGNSGIPAYSTLVFDMLLAKIKTNR